jgi:signal transduction histidine kinase
VSTLSDFFINNIIAVYFFYGLSFFSMGLAIFLEVGHSSELDFARALRPLAGFGLVHGGHEWFEMFLLMNPEAANSPACPWISAVRIILLAASFLMLFAFGARLIIGPSRKRFEFSLILIVIFVWVLGLLWVLQTQPSDCTPVVAVDVYTRYALAIPGAVLTAWGLILQRRRFIQAGMSSFGRDVALAALAFGLYGGIGQLFASPSTLFPSNYLNADVFIRWFGFPIQVFRAIMACFAAIFIIRSLRAFEEEDQRRIETLRDAQLAERRRLEAIRGELLHRTVKAQESERQRIARELHDETGQTLTALGMGLRGLSEMINNKPHRAVQQAQQLETLAVNGLDELQRMVSGLHPPQLDDLGLLAALRWYAGEITKRYGLPVNLNYLGNDPPLPPEMRVVFFRIAQEAITNIIRHSGASQASIFLDVNASEAYLRVDDNGQGFNVEKTLDSVESGRPCWGLLGMIERASLIGGECKIHSEPGLGTYVELRVSREGKSGE